MANQDLSLLLIDDDDVIAEAVVRNLRKHNVDLPIFTAQDGVDGLAMLRSKATGRTPIVLLDLKMPNMDGHEFLEEVRNDVALRSTVVFVLSTSDSHSDRSRAYDKCVAGYLVKSDLGAGHSKLANLIKSYQESVYLP